VIISLTAKQIKNEMTSSHREHHVMTLLFPGVERCRDFGFLDFWRIMIFSLFDDSSESTLKTSAGTMPMSKLQIIDDNK